MREIIFDTETTGLDPKTGDRLVEIGCVEMLNLIPTGATFQTYLDPQRDMPEGAFKVHGLSGPFLRGKPLFADKVEEFLAFIGDARLVAHNAEFDMRFINAELQKVGREAIGMERVVDTLALARRKHPGAPNSLDALCARYRIDNTKRSDAHGALVDSMILADVYAELTGGRQTALVLGQTAAGGRKGPAGRAGPRPEALGLRLSEAEKTAHAAFVAELGDKAIWKSYSL